VAVTAPEDGETVAPQLPVICWPEGRVKPSLQPFTAEEPVLVTVTSAVKPPCQTLVPYTTLHDDPGLPGLPGSVLPPVLTVEEKELTASPAPFCHGSKPACTLVRYQLFWARPRAIVCRTKSMTSKLQLESVEVAT